MNKEMYMKRIYLIIGFFCLFFILNLNLVSADNNMSFSATKSFDWLYKESLNKEWNLQADTLAFTILALRNEGGYDLTDALKELQDQESNDNWGRISESALATLAYYKMAEDVDDQIEWLLDKQITALTNGQWLIQFLVTSGDEGECRVTYEDDSYEFSIDGTTVTSDSCPTSSWINFEECIKRGSVGLNETMEISCIVGGVRPSILFRSFNNEYYIVDEGSPYVIENGCFASGFVCSCTETGFGSWALNLMGEHTYTTPYLQSSCRDTPVGLAFIYLLTGESINELSALQKDDGSFDGDVFQTAIAYLALKKGDGSAASKALTWLEWKQKPDGSWENDLRTTAAVLFAAFSQDLPPSGLGGGDGPIDSDVCVNDSECDTILGEACVNNRCTPRSQQGCSISNNECVLDSDCGDPTLYECTEAPECKCEEKDIPVGGCVSSAECDPGYRCDTFNNICVPSNQDDPDCNSNSDCEEKYDSSYECNVSSGLCEKKEGSSLLTWIIVIVIILVAGIGGYIAYNQFFKGKFKKKPGVFSPGPVHTSRPAYPTTRQRVPASRPVQREESRASRSGAETELERQLDESLKKARELITGKRK